MTENTDYFTDKEPADSGLVQKLMESRLPRSEWNTLRGTEVRNAAVGVEFMLQHGMINNTRKDIYEAFQRNLYKRN